MMIMIWNREVDQRKKGCLCCKDEHAHWRREKKRENVYCCFGDRIRIIVILHDQRYIHQDRDQHDVS